MPVNTLLLPAHASVIPRIFNLHTDLILPKHSSSNLMSRKILYSWWFVRRPSNNFIKHAHTCIQTQIQRHRYTCTNRLATGMGGGGQQEKEHKLKRRRIKMSTFSYKCDVTTWSPSKTKFIFNISRIFCMQFERLFSLSKRQFAQKPKKKRNKKEEVQIELSQNGRANVL